MPEDGAYIVNNTTYYVNPDTGAADDGGDTSTGEGMCRNATYEKSLYGAKGGQQYVILRIKLISFISDIHFSVQQKKGDAGSYSEVAYTVVGENTKENTKDFRFEVPAADVLIKPRFFVGPMNRDVTYFVGLDMDSAKEDGGAFAAFNGKAAEAKPTAATTPASGSAPGKDIPATAAPASKGAPKAADNESSPEKAGEAQNSPDSSAGNTAAEPSPDGKATQEQSPGTGKDGSQEVLGITGFMDNGDPMTVDADSKEDKDTGTSPGVFVWPAAAVLLLGGAAVILAVRRRAK